MRHPRVEYDNDTAQDKITRAQIKRHMSGTLLSMAHLQFFFRAGTADIACGSGRVCGKERVGSSSPRFLTMVPPPPQEGSLLSERPFGQSILPFEEPVVAVETFDCCTGLRRSRAFATISHIYYQGEKYVTDNMGEQMPHIMHHTPIAHAPQAIRMST